MSAAGSKLGPTPPETEPYAYADCRGRIMLAAKRQLTQSVRATNRYCIPLFKSDAVYAARIEGRREGFITGAASIEPVGHTGSLDSAIRDAVDAMRFLDDSGMILGSFDETYRSLHESRERLGRLVKAAKEMADATGGGDRCRCRDNLRAVLADIEGRKA